MLTANQKNQLNKDILEYLANSQYPIIAEAFSQQIGVGLNEVDPEGHKLEIKWKSILVLQRKITTLQEKVASLEEELAKGGGATKQTVINIEELYLPKTPAKFTMKGHKSTVTCMAFHPHFTQIATCSQDSTIKIWEFQTGDFQRTLKGHTNAVNWINYDNAGKFIVSCSSDLSIKLWDLNNDYQCCKTFYGHNHNISNVCFLPDNDYLLSCSRDNTLKLWQVSTGFCKRTFAGHENWVRAMTVSQDGKTFASCSSDQSIIIWQVDKEVPVNRFFAHQNVIDCIMMVEGEKALPLMNAQFLKSKFTQQSRLNALKKLESEGVNGIASYQQVFLFTGGRDKIIGLYLCPTGEHLHNFVGHDNWIRSFALHPTGKYLYSASDDRTIRIWELNFGQEKKKIQGAENFISTVRFNNKYAVLASTGNDMIVRIWALK